MVEELLHTSTNNRLLPCEEKFTLSLIRHTQSHGLQGHLTNTGSIVNIQNDIQIYQMAPLLQWLISCKD